MTPKENLVTTNEELARLVPETPGLARAQAMIQTIATLINRVDPSPPVRQKKGKTHKSWCSGSGHNEDLREWINPGHDERHTINCHVSRREEVSVQRREGYDHEYGPLRHGR